MRAADHRQLDLVGLDPERGEAGGDEILCRGPRLSISAATLRRRPSWPGSCKPPRRRAFDRGGRQNRGRNPGSEPGLPDRCLADRSRKPTAAAPGACRRSASPACSRRWSPSLRPAPADSAPLRVVVLGQTAETPPPSCPGKIVNNVEVIPCRVEGHVTGFQVDRRRRRRTLRGALRRQDRRLVDHPRRALAQGRPKRPPTRSASSTNSSASPREARIGVLRPVEGSKPPQYTLVRQSPLEVLNPYFGSTPDLRPRAPADRPPGPDRRPHRPDLGADVRLQRRRRKHLARQPPARTLLSKEDIQGGHPQQGVGKTKTYGCYYSNARLLYTATLVKAALSRRAQSAAWRRPQ